MHRKRARLGARAQQKGAAPGAYNRSMDEFRKAAAARGKQLGLTYAGAVTPAEAHALMGAGAKLVDVRTKPELAYVGSVPGAVAVEWQSYPGGTPNPDFIAQLSALVPKEQPVMFLCRSGARSHAAAQAATKA